MKSEILQTRLKTNQAIIIFNSYGILLRKEEERKEKCDFNESEKKIFLFLFLLLRTMNLVFNYFIVSVDRLRMTSKARDGSKFIFSK